MEKQPYPKGDYCQVPTAPLPPSCDAQAPTAGFNPNVVNYSQPPPPYAPPTGTHYVPAPMTYPMAPMGPQQPQPQQHAVYPQQQPFIQQQQPQPLTQPVYPVNQVTPLQQHPTKSYLGHILLALFTCCCCGCCLGCIALVLAVISRDLRRSRPQTASCFGSLSVAFSVSGIIIFTPFMVFIYLGTTFTSYVEEQKLKNETFCEDAVEWLKNDCKTMCFGDNSNCKPTHDATWIHSVSQFNVAAMNKTM